jgi:hypothetical protein
LIAINATSFHNFFSSFSGKVHQHSSILWKVIFIAQLVLVAYLSYTLSTILLGGGATFREFHNSDCQGENGIPDVDDIVINGTSSAPCAYDYNFKKVYATKYPILRLALLLSLLLRKLLFLSVTSYLHRSLSHIHLIASSTMLLSILYPPFSTLSVLVFCLFLLRQQLHMRNT